MSDKILSLIHAKVEKIADDVSDLKIIAAKHEETLQHHVKRSNTLEDLYSYLEKERIQPIEKDINKMRGMYQLFLGLGVLGSIILAALKIFGK